MAYSSYFGWLQGLMGKGRWIRDEGRVAMDDAYGLLGALSAPSTGVPPRLESPGVSAESERQGRRGHG